MSPLLQTFANASLRGFRNGGAPKGPYFIGNVSLGSGSGFGNAIVVDSSRSAYIPYQASSYSFIKLTSAGAFAFARRMNSAFSGNSSMIDLALDSSNNLFVAKRDTADGSNIYPILLKFDSSGTLQWQRKVLYQLSGFPTNVVLDSAGNAYIISKDTCIFKYDSSGVFQAAQVQLTSFTMSTQTGNIATDGSNIYWTGYDSTNSRQVIVKYNSSLVSQWQRTLTGLGASASVTSKRLTADSAGNVYFTGNTTLPVSAAAIVKYNSSGTLQWQRSISYSQAQASTSRGFGITVDSSGDIWISGTVRLGYSPDVFYAKFPSDGSKTGSIVVQTGTYSYAASSLTIGNATGTSSTVSYGTTSPAATSTTNNLSIQNLTPTVVTTTIP